MTDAVNLQKLAIALRELHRGLVGRAKRDFERDHSGVVTPGELLRLLTTDARFNWLRGLSELMVDLDLVADAKPPVLGELTGSVRAAVEYFITPPKSDEVAHAFAQHYWPAVHADPHVAMAHAAVKQALEPWPRPEKPDAGSLLHERHRLAEKARHRKPLKSLH
jgi:hypothetical protein